MSDNRSTSDAANEYDVRLRILFALIGQSLVLYQLIEIRLKILFPFIVPPGNSEPIDPWTEVVRLVGSRETMGPLVERFKKSISISSPDTFTPYLATVLNNRNELVHSFTKLSFGSPKDVETCNEAISYLDAKRKFAVPLLTLTQDILKEFVTHISGIEEHIDVTH